VVDVRYHGGPVTFTIPGTPLEAGFMHTDDGAVVAGEPEVAAAWYPVNDHPLDKATYSFPIYAMGFFDHGATLGETGVVAHELAHEWFGDSVAVHHWQDTWLNEGFATYGQCPSTGAATARPTSSSRWPTGSAART
jgi:aminopeptidase N